jgi:hypothetical protein
MCPVPRLPVCRGARGRKALNDIRVRGDVREAGGVFGDEARGEAVGAFRVVLGFRGAWLVRCGRAWLVRCGRAWVCWVGEGGRFGEDDGVVGAGGVADEGAVAGARAELGHDRGFSKYTIKRICELIMPRATRLSKIEQV